jgi:hypothetical protein
MSATIHPFRPRRLPVVLVEFAPRESGSRAFILTHVDEDGIPVIVWDGPSYRDAMCAAAEFVDEGVRLRDMTGGVR